MEQLFFCIFALIEMIIVRFICNVVMGLQYEYISIKYSEFKFANEKDRPIGLNILIQMIFPTCFIIVLAGIFYNYKIELIENIYMVTIYYYLLRWIKIIIILNRLKLYDWKSEIEMCLLGVIFSIVIYYNFIIKTNHIFLSLEELREGISIAVILFILALIRNYIYNYEIVKSKQESQKKRIYIKQKYVEFKEKYESFIDIGDVNIKNLIYAIMIYEDYNRPKIVRVIEKLKFLITGHATMGIMQVYSTKIINDRESVILGVKKIVDEVKREEKNNEFSEINVIKHYNPGDKYKNEVTYIFGVINEDR